MFKKSAVDLNSAFYPQPAFYSQSAVRILPLVRSLQSAVRSLQFTLTGKQYTYLCPGVQILLSNRNNTFVSVFRSQACDKHKIIALV